MELSDEESIRSYWKIKPGNIVVDVGACIGSWTLPALEMGANHVYCFEPSKEFISVLNRNIEARGWRDRVTIIDKALWHKEEKRVLYELDQSIISNFRGLHYPDEYIVDCIKLDSYPLEGLDWMKIDIEGAELAVLIGAKETLLRFEPNIIVEIHENLIKTIIPEFKTKDILNWLPPGYEMKKIDEAHHLLHQPCQSIS